MGKIAVVIGTSNHLPEGSPQSLFEETYQVCWRPWLSTLYRFPDIFSVVHYSGTVLAWLHSHHPEFIMLLEEMSSRKQVEAIGGGYFAPIMPIIPAPDRVGQLEFLSTLIRKLLGKRPRGVWPQDFAWEPSLVSTYSACGFDFSFLPVELFRLSGLDPSYPVMTEDQGKSLCIFPVIGSEQAGAGLIDLVGTLEAHFAGMDETAAGALMLSDTSLVELWRNSDFESPDVLFETMFASLRRDGELWETVLPSRWMRSMKDPPRGYFPCSCSPRLAAASVGGPGPGKVSNEGILATSRRLLLRHPESHALYAKMQFVRILVGQLRGDKSRKKSAQEEVWRAQCGDAYWEGQAGGILSLPIRSAAWSALIEAERSTRQKGSFVPGIIRADIDMDGQKEILFQGANYNAHVRLGEASLAEFDSFKSLTNYVNAMDGERPGDRLECFVDRLCEPGVFLPLAKEKQRAAYSLLDGGKPSMTASFTRAPLEDVDSKVSGLVVGKIYSFRRENLGVAWTLSDEKGEGARFRFATELNLSAGRLMGDVSLRISDALIRSDEGTGRQAITAFSIENSATLERLDFRSDRAFAFELLPLFRPVSFDGRSTLEWQGMRIWIGWDIALEPGAIEGLGLTLEIAHM